MTFLPVTLFPIVTFIIILGRDELRASLAGETNNDGRFAFEDSHCPQNWKRQLEPELERPSLELWAENDTKILERPSPTVIHLREEYQKKNNFGASLVKMICRAPYPVILLAALSLDTSGVEEFHLTTADIYNKSSFNFETQTLFSILYSSNFYYCQAVYNPCLKSREKLLHFYNSRAKVMSLTLRYYSFASGSISSNSDSNLHHHSDSTSNSTLNPNSSLILPSELKSILETEYNLNLNRKLKLLYSSSKDQNQQKDQNQSETNNTNDSECEALFYYEKFRDNSTYHEGKIRLRYFCEFSDGTPGTFKVSQRCGTWGRCRFLVAARKQKAKNCWRPHVRGKTCGNCTAEDVGINITEPFIPHCTTSGKDGDKMSKADVRVATDEANSPEEEDETEEPEADDDLEDVTTDETTDNFETATDEYEDDKEADDSEKKDEPPIAMSMTRSVEGTPLYVGLPPRGYEIQRPFIRTDAFDEDDIEESTLVRMNPFPEIQLFNTTIQITCEQDEYYTSQLFVFALEFQTKTEKGKEAKTNLQFFPVDNKNLELRYYGKGALKSQTLTIHLNRTDLTRIFCFAGVQNSYKWNNASRPIRVFEYRDFYKPSECLDENDNNSDSDLAQKGRPKFSMLYSQPTLVNTVEFDEDHPQLLLNDGDDLALTCSAYYPVQVLSTLNDTVVSGQFQKQFTVFKSFQNHSSYVFVLRASNFKPERENHFYRCQSLENPCLHRSIFYSYVPGPTGQLKFEYVPPNESDKANSLLGLEFGSPANYSECEVLFFYKELEDFPGYEFRCEFPMEEVGKVKFHYCDSLNDCANLYRNRRQPKVCWRKVENWRKCFDCKESRSVGFRPFVATCEINRIFYSYPSYEVGESRVMESTLGNFATFGLPNRTNGIALIYFSNEDIDSKGTLFLEPFEKYQLFNTSLNVTCVSSAYYMSSEDVHIAKFYGSRNELNFLDRNKNSRQLNPEEHEWRITQSIELGNDPDLTHIFCIGITWMNFRKQVNFSQEIHLQDPKAPQIILDAGNFEDTLRNTHLHATRNSQMSDAEQEYEFLVNSENQTLVCHAHGFPPPKIQWVTTAKNAPRPSETEVNSSHSVSRIFLPLIDASVQGTYNCTAMNSQGKVTASMKLDLKYPVNKSIVVIVTTSVLVLACLSIVMAFLWRRIRGLKKVLRDLTPEEVEEFHLGSRTVDPDDPHAEIYALPYDWSLEVPRELIELDETSILGAGQFGLVRSGFIKTRQDLTGKDEKKLVAIKQAKAKLGAEDFKNILSEIKVMAHLKQHENVLQILAACTTSIKKCQVLVVMEFCEMGDLHKYVRDRKFIFEDIFTAGPDPASGYAPMSTIMTDKFSTRTLVDFSMGIANGMSYLRQKRVVHGDLAARNVLLTKTLEVKVSDFGCSTHLINYASYTKNEQAVIPWRWFSIEALKEMKLSFKSDVWAFGVLLYEIFTLGELPYSGDELSVKFVEELAGGKRLKQPEFTNDEIYALMTDCWQKEPNERPTFQEIYDRLLLIKNELT